MRKDIEIPTAKEVYIAAVREWDTDFLEQQWNVYLINDRDDMISMVMVMSRGKSNDQKTSTLRHSLGDVPPKTAIKVEFIASEVLGFTNEYLLTFFAENKLFERTYSFPEHSISEENSAKVPVLKIEGVKAE